jgi:hypothetical protein
MTLPQIGAEEMAVEQAALEYERARGEAAKAPRAQLADSYARQIAAEKVLIDCLKRLFPPRAYAVRDWMYSLDSLGELWRRPVPRTYTRLRSSRRWRKDEGDLE